MTWFLIFATTVFALYFWIQHRARQKELNSPLEQPIQNNSGRIFLGNRQWNVRGPNLPIGSRVRVTGVDGTILLVDRTAA